MKKKHEVVSQEVFCALGVAEYALSEIPKKERSKIQQKALDNVRDTLKNIHPEGFRCVCGKIGG